MTDYPAFRAWFLLTIFVILFAGVNQFFGLRYVSPSPVPYIKSC